MTNEEMMAINDRVPDEKFWFVAEPYGDNHVMMSDFFGDPLAYTVQTREQAIEIANRILAAAKEGK